MKPSLLRRMPLRLRFLLGLCMVLLLLAFLGAVMFYVIGDTVGSLMTTGEDLVEKGALATRLQAEMQRALIIPHDHMIHGGVEQKDFNRSAVQVDRVFTRLRLRTATDRERMLIATSEREWARIKVISRSVLAVPNPAANPQARAEMERLDVHAERVLRSLSELQAGAGENTVRGMEQEARTARRRAALIIMVSFAFGSALAISTALLILRSIIQPLNNLSESAARFGAGELTYRAPVLTDDELGRSATTFNLMADKLEANLRELKLSETRYRAVTETAVDAIISIDQNGVIVSINKAGADLFGYAAHELLGVKLVALMPKRYRADHSRGIDRYLRTGEERIIGKTYEVSALRKDGAEFPIELSVAAWTVGDEVFFTGIIRDISERKEAERRLKELSVTDSLTGLFNHGEFSRLLEDEIERSRRYRRPCALLMIDVDRFKLVNDTYGHRVGDIALNNIAGILKKAVRKADKVARYGGEEFVVILPETSMGPATSMAERIRASVESEPIPLNGRRCKVTVSIGAAVFRDPADQAQDLIAQADLAMYAAKAEGRNRVRQYEQAA